MDLVQWKGSGKAHVLTTYRGVVLVETNTYLRLPPPEAQEPNLNADGKVAYSDVLYGPSWESTFRRTRSDLGPLSHDSLSLEPFQCDLSRADVCVSVDFGFFCRVLDINRWGFMLQSTRIDLPQRANGVAFAVPFWFLFLIALPIPVLQAKSLVVRTRRLNRGQCLSCGYDLRSSPRRCPECGEIGIRGRPDQRIVIVPST
jgi:hypothetical protein